MRKRGNMDKKAQLTIFIILGFVILIIVGGFFVIQSMTLGKTAEEEAKEIVGTPLQPVRVFVDNCVKQTAEDALLAIGLRGGYIEFPENVKTISINENPIAYWYYEGKDTRPYQTAIEGEINKYIDGNLAACIKDFEDFPGLTTGTISTKTTIADESVAVNVDYPVELKQGEASYKMSKFMVELPVRLGMMIEDANSIVDMELILNDVVDLTYIGELDSEIAFYRYEEDIILYTLNDKESLIYGIPYSLAFANKLILTDRIPNRAPQITNIANLTLTPGNHQYDVDAIDPDGDSLTFYASSPDLSVVNMDSATGIVSFTLSDNETAEHFIDVEVRDDKGLSGIATIRIEVEIS